MDAEGKFAKALRTTFFALLNVSIILSFPLVFLFSRLIWGKFDFDFYGPFLLFIGWLFLFQIISIKKISFLEIIRDKFRIAYFTQFFLFLYLLYTVVLFLNYYIPIREDWTGCQIKKCFSKEKDGNITFVMEVEIPRGFSFRKNTFETSRKVCSMSDSIQSLITTGIFYMRVNKGEYRATSYQNNEREIYVQKWHPKLNWVTIEILNSKEDIKFILPEEF